MSETSNVFNHNGKFVISEYYDFEGDAQVIREAEELHKPIILKCILQKADTENRNGRAYPFAVLKRESDKYMESIKDNTATGELDHPDSPVVSLTNVSHRVIEMHWEGTTLLGKIQILDTPSGNILKGLLKGGVKLGISSRGIGSVKKSQGLDVVQEDFDLICFDVVSSPSTPGAYLFKEGKQWGMTPLKISLESLNKNIKEEDKFKKINDLSQENFWK
jgi:hypothetical protein